MDQSPYSITEVAEELGITPRTIRFWENRGLITPAREGGKRVYSRRDRTRLKLAQRGKRLGFSLAEIKELINLYDADRGDRQQLTTLLEALDRRKHALRQQSEDIAAVLDELEKVEANCRRALGPPAPADPAKS